jgi:hypothetical protein
MAAVTFIFLSVRCVHLVIYARQNVLKPDLAVSCQAGDHRDSRRQSTSRAKCMYRCLKQTMPSQDAAKIVLALANVVSQQLVGSS